MSQPHTIVVAGHTGDGTQFCGRILADAAAEAGLHPTLFAQPGQAMNGDPSSVHLVVSDAPALVPGTPEWLLVLRPWAGEWPATHRLVDANRAAAVAGWQFEALKLATQAGLAKGASVVLLGALATKLAWLNEAVLLRALKERLHEQPRAIALNMACFRAGLAAANQTAPSPAT